MQGYHGNSLNAKTCGIKRVHLVLLFHLVHLFIMFICSSSPHSQTSLNGEATVVSKTSVSASAVFYSLNVASSSSFLFHYALENETVSRYVNGFKLR